MALPKSWNELTVGDFIKIVPIINNQDYENNLERLIDIACALTGKPVADMSMNEIAALSFLSDPGKIETRLPRFFYLKGKFYKPITDFRNITGGQYIDLSSYCKNQDKIMENIHYLSAIVCDEVSWYGGKKKYDGEKLNEKAELFKQLPITVLYPITLFFCTNLLALTDAIQTYLEQEIQKKAQKVLRLYGGGSSISTLWRRVTGRSGISLQQ